MTDEEIRKLCFNETEREVQEFKDGWAYRVEHGEGPEPDAQQLMAHLDQDLRISWSIGWNCANAVYLLRYDDSLEMNETGIARDLNKAAIRAKALRVLIGRLRVEYDHLENLLR